MNLTRSYKGYLGSAEIDFEENICCGKVLFINDLITYQAETPDKLQAEFEAAVDDYLSTCEKLGRQPKKAASGSFNVRVSPEDHRRALVCAAVEDISLNELMKKALSNYLSDDQALPAPTTINHVVVFQSGESQTREAPRNFTLTGSALEVGHYGNC